MDHQNLPDRADVITPAGNFLTSVFYKKSTSSPLHLHSLFYPSLIQPSCKRISSTYTNIRAFEKRWRTPSQLSCLPVLPFWAWLKQPSKGLISRIINPPTITSKGLTRPALGSSSLRYVPGGEGDGLILTQIRSPSTPPAKPCLQGYGGNDLHQPYLFQPIHWSHQ